MKKNEVRLWIDYHKSVFPTWTYGGESKEAKAIAFEAIAKALRSVELDDAREVSDRMVAGTIPRPFPEELIGVVCREARKVGMERFASQRPKRLGGELTYECPYCQDTGFVECWRRNLVDKMICLCSCEVGSRKLKAYSRDTQQYDPIRCYRVGDESEYWLRIRAKREADIVAGVEPMEDGTFKTVQEYEAFDRRRFIERVERMRL